MPIILSWIWKHHHASSHKHSNSIYIHIQLVRLPPPFHWVAGSSVDSVPDAAAVVWLRLMCRSLVRRRIDRLLISSACGTEQGVNGPRLGALGTCPILSLDQRAGSRLTATVLNDIDIMTGSALRALKSSGNNLYTLWVLICHAKTNTVTNVLHWDHQAASYTETLTLSLKRQKFVEKCWWSLQDLCTFWQRNNHRHRLTKLGHFVFNVSKTKKVW